MKALLLLFLFALIGCSEQTREELEEVISHPPVDHGNYIYCVDSDINKACMDFIENNGVIYAATLHVPNYDEEGLVNFDMVDLYEPDYDLPFWEGCKNAMFNDFGYAVSIVACGHTVVFKRMGLDYYMVNDHYFEIFGDEYLEHMTYDSSFFDL